MTNFYDRGNKTSNAVLFEVNKGMLKQLCSEAKKRNVGSEFIIGGPTFDERVELNLYTMLPSREDCESRWAGRARLYHPKLPNYVDIVCIGGHFCFSAEGARQIAEFNNPDCAGIVIDWFLAFSEAIEREGFRKELEYYGM